MNTYFWLWLVLGLLPTTLERRVSADRRLLMIGAPLWQFELVRAGADDLAWRLRLPLVVLLREVIGRIAA